MRFQIRVYEGDSGRLIDSAEVSGRSRPVSLGGGRPENLLDWAVGDYVTLLFASGKR